MSLVNVGRFALAGVVGGLIGATLMTIVLVGSKLVMGLPLLADFVIMGTFVGGGSSAIAAGFTAHYIVGIVAGVIFGVVAAYVGSLRPVSGGRATALGLLYGIILWIVLFVPTAMFGFAPIMMRMMGPAATNMMPTVMGIAFLEHLLFGLSVAGFVYLTAR